MAKDKEFELTVDNLITQKGQDAIRKAWDSGKRTLDISGRKFMISKQTRNVSFVVGGESKRRKETWLTVRPTDGSLLPSASIELKYQGNMRTVISR